MNRATRLFPALRLLLCGLAAGLPLRGQVTERPETVAPGRVLLRMDGLKLAMDREDAAGNTHSTMGVASTTVRAGLTATVDLQVGFDLYLRESFTRRGRKDHHSGLGDVSLRTKWVFWRDDKSGAAAAILPFVRFPTGSNVVASKATEGGIIVPWAMDTGGGLRTGAMFEWDLLRNPADNGYDSRWFASGFVQQDLTSTIAGYAEATLEASSAGSSNWAGTVGVGALWRVSKRIRLDYELQRGLNDRAARWTHTWRLDWEW